MMLRPLFSVVLFLKSPVISELMGATLARDAKWRFLAPPLRGLAATNREVYSVEFSRSRFLVVRT